MFKINYRFKHFYLLISKFNKVYNYQLNMVLAEFHLKMCLAYKLFRSILLARENKGAKKRPENLE